MQFIYVDLLDVVWIYLTVYSKDLLPDVHQYINKQHCRSGLVGALFKFA